MSGGDEFAIEHIGPFEQRFPFDMRITENTWVGSASGQVFFNKIIDDEIAKFIADIQDVVREPEANGKGAGIIDGIQAATAGFLRGAARSGIIPGLDRKSTRLNSSP